MGRETDKPFKRYCEEHGLCNRVVFDTVWKMARDEYRRKKVTFECRVDSVNGDVLRCTCYELTENSLREELEIEIPGHKWVPGHFFYLVIPDDLTDDSAEVDYNQPEA